MRVYKLTHLSIIFVLFIVLSATIMLGLILKHMEAISDEQDNFQSIEAKKELKRVIKSLKFELIKTQNEISEWGETKQQFHNREFYKLWQDNRVPASGKLHPEFKDFSLYDIDGRIFASPNKNSALPVNIFKGDTYLQKHIKNGKEYWLYVFPIIAVDLTGISESNQITIGYGGVTFPIIKVFSTLNNFNVINIQSIASVYDDQARFKLKSLDGSIKYEINDDIYRQKIISSTNNAFLQIGVLIVISMLIAIVFINKLLVKPLRNISLNIQSFNEDSLSAETALKSQPILELENLRHAFNDYQSKLISSQNILEKNNHEFFRIAHEDSLTGAYNRRAFEDDWADNYDKNHSAKYSLLIFDCDNFKPINDSYGHAVGDAVIQNVAKSLMVALKHKSKLYRLGGDEFSAILNEHTEKEVLEIAEVCREHVLAYDFRKYGLSESISVSIGIAISTERGASFSSIMKQADLAMYKAKKPGESSIVFYTEDLSTVESVISTNAVNAVFSAIKNPNKIKMRYQPVVKLPSLDVSYLEALVMINHDGKSYMPNLIFPIVEGRNLDVEFDLAVLSAIANDLRSNSFHKGKGVSLNLSAPSVINTRVIDFLVKMKINFPKVKFVVEITETALITQIEKASKNITQLRDSGYLIALDDFGSGYSSLRYLTSMPVDIIKFDITMVHLLESDNEEHRKMIVKLTELIIDLDYDIVAEGIESQSLLDKVIELGFSYSQGYFTGRPEVLS